MRALVLACAGLFVVAACGSTSSGTSITLASSQELRMNIGTEPTSLDPGQQQWNYDAAVGRQVFETLVKPTKDLKGITGLAADSYSVDSTGTIYTFKLHPGAKWSDGQPVKAADFVYGWQRLLDPRLAAAYASYYYIVKNASKVHNMDPKDPGVDAALQTLGLKAVDDNTFQVTLESPAGYFKWVATLWTGAPVRQDIVAKAGKDSTGTDLWGAVSPSAVQNLIGNGQYKVSEVVPKDHITLVVNPNYAGSQPKPTLTKITEYEINDETVAYAKYKSGELDSENPVPLPDTDLVKSDPLLSKELVITPALTVFWIDINVKKAPFDNVKVRQAFAQAIDRDALAANVFKGRVTPITTLIPNGMRDFNPSLGASQNFNAANAKASLAASGMTADQINAMNITYEYRSSSADNKTIAEFVQAQLKTNLGINIQVGGKDSKTVSKDLRTLNYTIGGLSGWGADYPDEQDWYDIFVTGSSNQFDGYSNTTYDNAVSSADSATDQAKRDQLYNTAGQQLVSDAPVIFLYQRTNWALVKPYVKNATYTAIDDVPGFGGFFTYTTELAQHS
jgi:oligopeptide transport system substrate-binding protein